MSSYPDPKPEFALDIGRLAGLAVWRLGKGVYRFDDAFAQAVDSSKFGDEIPPELLFNLPEWGVYVVGPFTEARSFDVKGFFAHLEWDVGAGRPELRILWDLDDTEANPWLLPQPIYLDRPLLQGAAAVFENSHAAMVGGIENPDEPGNPALHDPKSLDELTSLAKVAIVRLLALVVDEPDISDVNRPDNQPTPAKPHKRGRWFGAPGTQTWNVGYRIGTALRTRLDTMPGDNQTNPNRRASPRPHVRAAHFRVYWTGPGRTTPTLRWIKPSLIGAGELPITERPVNQSDNTTSP